MFLKRLPVTSNASRNTCAITSKWYSRTKHRKLTFTKFSKSGRCSNTGRLIIRTKSSILQKVKLPILNYNMRLKDPSFISTFHLVPFSSKLATLVVFASGACTYLPVSDKSNIFGLARFSGSRLRFSSLSTAATYSLLFTATKLKKISNLELIPGKGVQYSRSAGCSSRVVSVDKANHSALVKLPSGVRKLFSLHSLVTPSEAPLRVKRKLVNTKSGFWRSYGVKPIVRGVARNPVDHPHGGRTKAIKYPRTPWGKTTKFK